MAFRLPKTNGMLRREAADWLARLQSDRDPEIQRKFERWRDADPRHAAAIDKIRGWYDRAGVLRHSPLAASTPRESSTREPQWRPRPALAAAASILVLVSAGFILFRTINLPFAGTDAVMLMTSVGEIKQVSLADGSKVTLDTASKVDVEIGKSGRTAHLRYGRARFRIAPASAPFVVETGNSRVTSEQGIIDVEQAGQQSRVQVLAGTAEVRAFSQLQTSPIALGVGQGISVNSNGVGEKVVAAPNPDWTRGMLQFDGTPLADAVALANRYSQRHIVIADDLRALRVTGAFRAGDTNGLAKALAAAFGLSLEQRADGDMVLSRSTSRARPNKTGW